MVERKLLFTLSKNLGDFIVQPFKGSGKGGQKRNKTMSCCRITHPVSGVVSECQEERSYEQNKNKAFERLLEKPEFVQWHKLETAQRLGIIVNAETQVEKLMNQKENFKYEIKVNGKWVKINEAEIRRELL